VYSLGLLLYYLLLGRRPAGREEEVQRPSASSPKALSRQLSGDLDSIVLKALRREPDQRYISVEQLATDIPRYRDGLARDRSPGHHTLPDGEVCA
jgi:serine/threonine protein kinase